MNRNRDDLKFFLAVSRPNTIAAVATRLQLTRSTVSRRIIVLEKNICGKKPSQSAIRYNPDEK